MFLFTSPCSERVGASIHPRGFAVACPALLLAAALTSCNQQQSAASEKVALAPADAASQVASATAQPTSAPASIPAAITPQEQAVLQRAQERWDALVAHDFERAWLYLTPAEREKVKQQDYRTNFGGDAVWKAAVARRARCIAAERCAVLVVLEVKVLAPQFQQLFPEIEREVEEEWVTEGGQWWYRGLRRAVPKEGEAPLPSAVDPSEIPAPQSPEPDEPPLGPA